MVIKKKFELKALCWIRSYNSTNHYQNSGLSELTGTIAVKVEGVLWT
jgi:hypothetical protein